MENGKRDNIDNIIYSKSYPDSTTIYAEEKRDKRKELAAVTMWKTKNTTLTDANRDATPISDLSGVVSAGKGTKNNSDQFRGRLKEAFDFLIKHKSGDLLGVFHRDGFGDIDLVWGDKGGGAEHIIDKHVGEGKSFATEEEAFTEIDRIKTVFGRDRYVVENGERILAWDKNITPEQEALLRGHNYREYPTIQELSAAKVGNYSETETPSSAETVGSTATETGEKLGVKLTDADLRYILWRSHENMTENGIFVSDIRGLFPKDNVEWLN